MENHRQRGNDIGPTGKTVAANIGRTRRAQQISLQSLEQRLIEVGRRISLSGLSKIENGDRKVDVDDLMAIAICLDVPPTSLMLPVADPDDLVKVTGLTASLASLWEWAVAADVGVSPSDERAFKARALPGWFEVTSELAWKDGHELILGVVRDGEFIERQVIRFGMPWQFDTTMEAKNGVYPATT